MENPALLEVCEALADLGLIDETFNPTLLTQEPACPIFYRIIGTICEELNPYAFSYNPSESSSPLSSSLKFEQQVCNFATSLGYSINDLSTPWLRLSILEFLSTELQTQRLRTQNRVRSLKYSLDDLQFTSGLSNLIKLLNVSLESTSLSVTTKSISQIQVLVKSLIKIIEKNLMNIKIKPLLGHDIKYTKEQIKHLEELNKNFHDEYKERKSLLLKRLNVTVEAFTYSSKCRQEDKDGFIRRLKAMKTQVEVRNQMPISVMDALVSDVKLLENERRFSGGGNVDSGNGDDGNNVRKVLMGNVPDRGGRIGKDGEAMHGGRKGKGKKKRKKGKKRERDLGIS